MAAYENIYTWNLKMIKTNSQAYQDIFAYSVIGKNGTYIEIGANKPSKNNNTYELEISHNWKGFSIEFNTKLKKHWDISDRKNAIFWDDAITFNYVQALEQTNLPLEIDYLSCDIEPPSNTFAALQAVIQQGIKFKCITFEHDLYASKDVDYDIISRSFLENNGYKVAVKNVYWDNNPNNHFETWYVRNDLNFETITFDDWKIKIKNAYPEIQFS